ncbi:MULTISPECIES: TetR/AcrR family transcriptional regulator [Paenibacillus]|uniref:TetR family transcriptional regulator n=1 Tax=Paenibacillus campinasensis TaxID=66347 RepID=A0ABW9SY83_9BACL|nr:MULTISPECIES: TetR/AcrR family transcriptional regulator [Paenibacillus]MUG65792.1 TetR family transcriptional regulator [Paenibacillus campinasensis]PAK55697.1 TetR family transcriptional regulator [Paenibacillus sp. 7541]
MRIVKEHDVRRKELLDTAEKLFTTKGYNETTINDIREAIGIAKGTFYHYFKSKEEILDAIIDRIIEQDLIRARDIVADPSISPMEKLYRVLLAQRPSSGDSKEEITQSLHEPENAEMHLKTMIRAIESLAPVITEVIEQGIASGDFHTEYPREVVDMLLITGQMLFDEALFQWSPEEQLRRLQAFIQAMELLLGASKGSFDFMYDILMGG